MSDDPKSEEERKSEKALGLGAAETVVVGTAVVEAKENNKPLGTEHATGATVCEMLDVPFAFSSNGDAFSVHDRTGEAGTTETEIGLRIDRLEEHMELDWKIFPSAVARGAQYVLPEPLREKIPACWSIAATKL